MSRIMFIDGSHREQIRVAVTEKGRVIEFDIESSDKKQTIGNIYLAKVTRVEPSLQAAFVEYGSGRQGFLSFSEIHPDYYQIPLEDRKRLLEEAADFYNNQADDDEDIIDDIIKDTMKDDNTDEDIETPLNEDVQNIAYNSFTTHDNSIVDNLSDSEPDSENNIDEETPFHNDYDDSSDMILEDLKNNTSDDSDSNDDVSEDSFRKSHIKKPRLPRYKIQEVIKKRQILLVQVLKSERGNKGAALTTYLSLAGRYCVLMPNTSRGGGISRKITNIADRQKLKTAIKEFQVPQGMGLIIRTAGSQRTKAELRRDYEYLLRLWDNVRQLTMSSVAPALVYEEGDLIKRTLRDVYTKDTTKILVQGDEVYKQARDIMKMIMPSAVRYIHHYQNPVPLLSRYQIETQLDELSSSQVTLKSGGYLVINHTEALIAIDVNSGKLTNAYSIEETALRTNLEAAEEIARQLRLRDLAGLIVIDFIDMEDYNNVRNLERKMRDYLKSDKARLQIAPISIFGLMEMTRQRLRPAMKDLMSTSCQHCQGMGFVPSLETSALRVLRAIFHEISLRPVSELTMTCAIDIAHYLLNKKRKELSDVEQEYNLSINILSSSKCANSEYTIDTILNEVAQSTRIPKAYQEDDFDEILISEDDDILTEESEEIVLPTEQENVTDQGERRRNSGRNKRHLTKNNFRHEKNIFPPADNNETSTRTYDKRTNSKLSRPHNKRGRFFDKFKSDADIFVTASGNEVIIENCISIRDYLNNVVDNSKNQEDGLSNNNHDTKINQHLTEYDNIADNKVLDNLVVETRINLINNEKNTHGTQSNFESDAELLTYVDTAENNDVVNDVNINLSSNTQNKQIENQELQQQELQNNQDSYSSINDEKKSARLGWWRNRFGL